ncbi:hypothetical protein N7490_010764 [Penicillium lividum]|nr:hypothetical protein N7490_010764 [Penicillium lividum]
MFKALMGGGRSDTRSVTSSSSKSRRRADSSKSSHSRKTSRGDDRDRGLDDSPYPPSASGSRRGPSSVAGDSVASTYMTAEPEPIGSPDAMIIERTPKRRDSDRESKSSRRRARDRSESRERDKGKSRRSIGDGVDDVDERDRRERRRTQPGEPYVPPISTSMPPSAPAAQFPIDMGAPGFSQFPGQVNQPTFGSPHHDTSPHHGTSPAPYDPHVQQQFPGQFPTTTAEPYYPPNNPAGAAADYYGDQGQSVGEQPGVRPHKPAVIPNSQVHLMTASPSANPPPEPSSLGEVGAAAAYFDDDFQVPEALVNPTASKPPKPGKINSKPTKPSKPSQSPSSSAVPAIAAGVAAYGLSSAMSSYHSESHETTVHQSTSYSQPAIHQSNSYTQPAAPIASIPSVSKPPHSQGIGADVGLAAVGAAGVAAAGAGYMVSHQHHSSPENTSQYTFQHYEQPPSAGLPPHGSGPNNAIVPGGPEGYPMQNPGFYPHGTGALAMRHRPKGPMSKFADFWRDPEGVGRFEDYTESIGVCKYCFEPGSTCLDAPRKHHYNRRRHSSDRYSSSSASRVSKLSRYQSSEDESRRHKKSHWSNKSTSWLPALGLFAGKEFKDSYSVRPGRGADDRVSSYDAETTSLSDRRSYTSRGVIRRPGSPREHYAESKYSRQTRSRSRSSSPSRHSFVKEAALGAAIGGAALAVAKSHQRSRSRSPSRVERRKESSSSSSFLDVSRSSPKSRSVFTSFFTASSENRKKQKKQKKRTKRKGFFSFNSSSSSSLDADLAFGSGFAKKSKSKSKKEENKEDVDAALLGLGATATALAASAHGRSRTTGQILTTREARSRHSNYMSSANEDEEWIDESDDQSSDSVPSALAFGGSSADSGSDSSRRGWGFFGFNKKKKSKKEKSSIGNAAAAGAVALGGAAIASVARHRGSGVSNSSGSLQQLYPTATSDFDRFDATRMSPSGEPPLVRPGPIPLQQPQPFTPVSQAVYTTQGGQPGSIPAYAPEVPLAIANDPPYAQQFQGFRDPAFVPEDRQSDRRQHRRSDSTPVFPIQDPLISGPKRRSTTRESASVSFDLTQKQEEQQRRRERYPEDLPYQPVQLIDLEEKAKQEEEQREFERQERRRRDQEDEDRRRRQQEDDDRRRRQQEDDDRRRRLEQEEDRLRRQQEDEDRRRDARKEKDSSSWVEAAAIGALGGAAASTLISRKSDNAAPSEASSDRYSKRREQRRKEREESRIESSIVSRPEAVMPVEEPATSVVYKEEQVKTSPRHSPRSSPVYDSYADFYAPDLHDKSHQEEQTHEPDDQPTIVEVVPASEREREHEQEKSNIPKDDRVDMHQFAQEPYEGYASLPFRVPELIYTKPTPEQSVNGSACGVNSPVAPPDTSVEREHEHERQVEPETESEPAPQPEAVPVIQPEPEHQPELEHETEPEFKSTERSTTGSRVSWGHDKTHEYEVPSSSEHDPTDYDISPLDDLRKEFPLTTPEEEKGKRESDKDFGTDIEFAAIVAAGTKAAGFDPSVVLNDPKYHTRTSPPGSEDEGVFSPRSKWAENGQSHGFVEGEVESDELDKSKDIKNSFEYVVEDKPSYSEPEYVTKDEVPSPDTREKGSIAQRVMDELERKTSPPRYAENDVFSMPGGFDSPAEPQEPLYSHDDSRSVFSAPVGKEIDMPTKARKSRQSDDFDLSRDIAPAIIEGAEVIGDEDKKKHRKRRSKRDSDTVSVDAESVVTLDDDEKSERRRRRHRSSHEDLDDAASTFTVEDDDTKSERRRRRHHSSRDDNDDAASTFTVEDEDGKPERRRRSHRSRHGDDDDARSTRSTRSTGDDDAKSERRTHSRHSSRDSLHDDRDKRRSKDDKEKSGSIFRSLFGSKVSAPEERRSSSRSSSLDKRAARDTVSEAGVDDERRRRKKRSSSSRHSSSGDKLDGYDSDKVSVKDDANLEDYRSKRQEKEEKRRQRYGDIVDSGRRRESEKV